MSEAHNSGSDRPSPSHRRTQAERKSEAERALINAAADIICERGELQFSLAEVGARAGYSRGLVNHHFGNKDALVARLSEQLLSDFARSVHIDETLCGFDGLTALMDAMLDRANTAKRDLRSRLVIWTAGLSSPTVRPIAAEADRIVRAACAKWVRKGLQDGSITEPVDEAAFAITLLGMYRGVCLQLLIAPELSVPGGPNSDSAASNPSSSEEGLTHVRQACHCFLRGTLRGNAEAR